MHTGYLHPACRSSTDGVGCNGSFSNSYKAHDNGDQGTH